jgi:hypothetical protein
MNPSNPEPMNPFTHTPEPWYYENVAGLHAAFDSLGGPVATFDSEDKARRIVAAVNGCKGIPDPETTVPQMVAVLRDAFDMIERMEKDVDYYISDEALARREKIETLLAKINTNQKGTK